MPPEAALEPATVVAARIRSKDLSPREALEAVLTQIEARDGELHAYLHVAADRAHVRSATAVLRR